MFHGLIPSAPPGDFMTDMQQRMKQEEERLAKLDPWKVMQNVVCDDQLFVWRKGFFILNCLQLPLLQSG